MLKLYFTTRFKFRFSHFLICSFFLCLFLFPFVGKGQERTTAFEPVLEEMMETRPTTYEAISGALRPFRYDSTLMLRFVERAKLTGYPDGESFAQNQLGILYRNISDYDRSLEFHQKALETARNANNIEMEVLSLNMIGVTYRRIDAVMSALDHNQKALELAESVKNPSIHIQRSISIAHNSLGNLYQSLEQYDLAIEQFQEALSREIKLSNKRGMAINNQNIGECLELIGDLDQALEFYRKSLAYNEEQHLEYGKIICNNSIAQVYLKKQLPEEALQLLEPLVEPMLKNNQDYISSSVYINLGWAHSMLNNYALAETYIKKGLSLALDSHIPNMEETAYKHLSELEERKGNFRASKEFMEKSYQIHKEISNAQNISYIHDVIVRYETEKKNNQIEALKSQKEIAELQLRKNKTSVLIGLLITVLAGTILFILYRQYQSNNEKRVLSLEQNMLRSQMNPHFLFNSLNSIKLYIINNDKKNAVHYLNKFSKLVRKILEGSSVKEITLDEELETADLYLNIENIRFSNEINYEITIEDDIQPEQIKIPSLVLQPFLENAIWHGLSPKEGDKNLWIHVSKVDGYHMEIRVRDNGVGRHASEKAKENRILKRKSVGIEITRERLANFAKDFQNDFDVTILDLYDDQGQSTGTEIVLKIPMV